MDECAFVAILAAGLRAIGVKEYRNEVKAIEAGLAAAHRAAKALRLGIKVKAIDLPMLATRFTTTLEGYRLLGKEASPGSIALNFETTTVAEFYMRELVPGVDTEQIKEMARAFIHAYEKKVRRA